ncbi:MFS transporter [Armatimonas sp.]|uniref:MFS transporter n=1 Tax=Armatimonas sp. TaxID=1872638 RepID=UPI00286A7433|nr:MFS transporter [Armatimonas sp.]
MKPIRTVGLRENLGQFLLLMLINAFVGGMVGLERTVVPLLGTQVFHLVLNSAITSFIVSFGITKALVNLLSGALADRFGRKKILVLGWLFGLPVPFLLIFAPSWQWIAFANVLLGINQGLAWSMAVVMKIDLVGPKQRGLAVGLNEFAGYLAVGVTALVTGYLASVYGLRPVPFYLGIGYAILGLALSVLFVRDTSDLVTKGATTTVPFREIFSRVSWKDRRLLGASQAGLVNNLNDGMSWGLFPLYFAAGGLDVAHIGVLKFVYPAVWGLAQIATGPLSDIIARRLLIGSGMVLQGIALGMTLLGTSFSLWLVATVLLGLGTALVYPALIAVVSDASEPDWRARALGVYRFWRDMGYAVGALLSSIIADLLGFAPAIGAVATLTVFSGLLALRLMRK